MRGPAALSTVLCFLLACFIPPPSHAQLSCPERIHQGEPLLCFVEAPEDSDQLELILMSSAKRRVASTQGFLLRKEPLGGAVYGGVLGVGCGLQPGRYVVRASGRAPGLAFRYSVPLLVVDRRFAEETVAFDSSLTDLVKAPNPERTRQSRVLSALLNSADVEAVYHLGRFVPPVAATRRTSGFGDIRRYVYSDGEVQYRIHAGIDYGVGTGTPVMACGAGRVVMAADRIVSGGSIVIEHLPGLYSLYFHLSSLEVEEGELVSPGRRIGLSGATGLATGPHLHWEVRAAGVAVDPDALLRGGLVDSGPSADVNYISIDLRPDGHVVSTVRCVNGRLTR